MGEECSCIIEDLLLRQPFFSRSSAEKKQIVDRGRPTPSFNLITLTKDRIRRFNKGWYEKDAWLCGCKKLWALFCWPCLLFSTEKNVWITKGVCDINSFHVLKTRHRVSVAHVKSIVALEKFGKTRKEESLDQAFKIENDKQDDNVKTDKYIVSCLIDAVCFLAEQELPFTCEIEHSDSGNRGNFIELLYHRASYDEKLRNHLETSTVFDGSLQDILNALIESVSTVLLDKIKEEVNNTPFVSIIEDEVMNLMHTSQLSSILRYVTPDGIQERFIRFTDVGPDRSAVSLANHVLNVINEFQIGEKLVAQTYDGCSVMAGIHKDLQKIILAEFQTALFVHYNADKLNWVLKRSFGNIQECKMFFENLSGFSAFFSRSSKLKAAFDAVAAKHLPSSAATHLMYTEKMFEVLSEVKEDLKAIFKSIMNNTNEWDGETRICSRGFYATLRDFEFIFLLNLFSMVLPRAKILFNILQSRVDNCGMIEDFKGFLNDRRDKFDEFWKQCQDECCTSELSEEVIPSKRQQLDNTDCDKKDSYQRLYYEVLDTFVGHITNHFSEMNNLDFLALLDFDSFEHYTKSFPTSAFDSLIKSYGCFFNPLLLKTEFSAIYASSEFKKTSVLELYNYLTCSGLNLALPEVTKCCVLILTIPVSSPSVERSFSTAKRIKTYLRNTQTHERSTKLSLISVEKGLLKSIRRIPGFHEKVINIYEARNPHIELS